MSLSGIQFSRSPALQLPLVNGWKDYGGGYGGAEYRLDGKTVTVSGPSLVLYEFR